MEAAKRSTTPPPRRISSPSLRGKKVWGRIPPPERLWQESLRSEEDLPTFGKPKDSSVLMTMVNETMAELQKAGRKQPRSPREVHAVKTMELETSKQKLIEQIVRRTLGERREEEREEGSRRVETEGERVKSRALSPQPSDRSSSPTSAHSHSSSIRRLTDELRTAHEKNRKLEEMYATLLSRKGPVPESNYKKKYEDLAERFSQEEVSHT